MIKIVGDDLARITKNAMMFVNPKSLWLREVLFEISGLKISVYACDDYFAVADNAPLVSGGNWSFCLNLEDVKLLEAFARKNKKEDIVISFSDPKVIFSTTDETLTLDEAPFSEDNWYVVDGLIFSPEITPVSIGGFRSNPERYAKLSQLKYDKNKFGIEWNFVQTYTGNLIIRFSVGETLHGAIRPLSEPQETSLEDDNQIPEE